MVHEPSVVCVAADPVEEGPRVVDDRVGANDVVEDGEGVGEVVAPHSDRRLQRCCSDGSCPAGVQPVSEVQQACEADADTGDFGCPVGDVREHSLLTELRFELCLELSQSFLGVRAERQDRRFGEVGQAGHERPDLDIVGITDVIGTGRGRSCAGLR